ncbi:MAG: ABC transporter ATP-binding protein [Flavobacteriales bacterium]|nr:ABC transporter ATP-binding protein [Flavobacteriales bacterium]
MAPSNAQSQVALRWANVSVSIGDKPVLHDINLEVAAGGTLALVGESGSGKTMCCMAALGLLPSGGRLTQGEVSGLGGVWAQSGGGQTSAIPRGHGVTMVFQEPMTSLDPTMRCGQQIAEVIRRHNGSDARQAKQRVMALFEEVQMPDPARAWSAYPHALSGGQKQRVLIAMALANDPDLILADEPTTALDSTLRAELLGLLSEIQRKRGLALVLVTHDMEVVERAADHVAVLRHGRVVEQGRVGQILANAQHPYTRGLLACRVPKQGRPSPLPVLTDFLEGGNPSVQETGQITMPDADQPVLLEVDGAWKSYADSTVPAMADVSLQLARGGTLGVVGGSGCGKTTLARAILGLHRLDQGTIRIGGRSVEGLAPDQLQHIRSNVGLVFQDPRAALNPTRKVGAAIREVLVRWGHDRDSAAQEARQLIASVGLEEDALDRRPDAFSGGQRQRIVIARALAANPQLLICDEAVAALDVSVQAQVLNLLVKLKEERGLALLFISHDLGVVRYLCDHTVVMDQGRVVESGVSDALWSTPNHEVTRRLQAAGGGSIA